VHCSDFSQIDELIQLLAEHRETLERLTFGCVTESEMRECDVRKERINDLYGDLLKPSSVK
jgi:hypothetical protein